MVSLTASSYNPVSLESQVLPKAKLNRAYSPVSFAEFLSASIEDALDYSQVTWQLEGALPAGLSFDDQTGILSGTPIVLILRALKFNRPRYTTAGLFL